MADPVLYEGAWGGVRLWMSKISTDEGRTLVVQPYTTGDVPDVQNRGGNSKIARVSLLFDDMAGEALDGRARLAALIELKDLGLPAVFTHPLKGSYLAEIGELGDEIDDNGVIRADATFIAVEEVRAVVQPGSGATLAAGTGQVSAAADDVDAIGMYALLAKDPDITDDARAAVSSWQSALTDAETTFATARQIFVDVASLSDRISNEIDDLKLEADVALWPILKSLVMLSEAIRAAGATATGDLGQLITVRIDQPMALRSLIASVYPADQGDARRADALALNDIRTPARIPSGTTLRLVQPQR